MDVLKENTREQSHIINYLQVTGDKLPPGGDLDYVFSIGVVHHIPDSDPTLKAAFKALKPCGRIVLWLYGKEGNFPYILAVKFIRMATRHMGHTFVNFVAYLLLTFLYLYMLLCRVLPLPLATYAREVLWKMPVKGLRLIIYDQLNPHYAKYYSYAQAVNLLRNNGFVAVQISHRLGYSWTVLGVKPGPLGGKR